MGQTTKGFLYLLPKQGYNHQQFYTICPGRILMNCLVRKNGAQTCYLEIIRCRSSKETDLPKGYHQLWRSMLCNKRGLEAEKIRAMAYSSCYPSHSITCSIAMSSYRKLGLFFFFLLLSNTGRRGRNNKQEERKVYKGGFQEFTHKNCRKWEQPFWTKMGSLIGLPLDF
jgi:hypothetical protein